MANAKKKTKSKTKKYTKKLSRNTKLAALFVLIFAVVGVYFLIKSFAATGALITPTNFKPLLSQGAKIITEPKKNGTNQAGKQVVKLQSGNNTSAAFILTTANLDAGQYKACPFVWAQINTVSGKTTVRPYNGGVLGAATSGNYVQAHSSDFSRTTCVPFTLNFSSPGIRVDMSNVSGGPLHIAYINIISTATISAPTVNLTASPSLINTGQSSNLTWTTSNASTCTASGAWSGSKALSGSQNTGTLSSSQTYKLSCTGPGGTTLDSATVTVQTPPPPAGGFYGVNAYHTSDLGHIANTGVTEIRVDNPDSSWFTAAKSNGLTILPQLNYNCWTDLGGGGDCHGGVQPQYDNTWAQRMVDSVYHAASTAGAPKPEALEVYNEPWNCGFWRTPSNLTQRAGDYLSLVKATANYAWSHYDSNVLILVSSDTLDSACGAGNWRAPLLAADTTHFLADSRIHPTVHPYAEARSPTEMNVAGNHCAWDFTRYDCAYNDYKSHGSNDPTVWVTEYGWRSSGTSSVGLTTQASYTTTAMNMLANSGIVDKEFAWLYGSGSFYTQNGEDWLDGNNNCKPVCAAVHDYIAAH